MCLAEVFQSGAHLGVVHVSDLLLVSSINNSSVSSQVQNVVGAGFSEVTCFSGGTSRVVESKTDSVIRHHRDLSRKAAF